MSAFQEAELRGRKVSELGGECWSKSCSPQREGREGGKHHGDPLCTSLQRLQPVVVVPAHRWGEHCLIVCGKRELRDRLQSPKVEGEERLPQVVP